MLKIERQNLIDQEIRKVGFVLVPSLCEALDCSEETIRRDLQRDGIGREAGPYPRGRLFG